MNKKSIKNIIFDLGVVIINIDSNKSAQAMKQLGFNDFENSYNLFKQTNLFDKLEKGLINPDEFRNELRNHVKDEVPDEKFDEAWGAMLLDFPESRINRIKELSKNYNIYLLSNTNEIHYHQYINDFYKTYGFEFNSLFSKAYYSFQVGYRKPDSKIYEHVLKDSNLIAEESLFIDDLQVNLEPAKKLGIQTMWIDPSNGDDIVQKLLNF